MRLSPEDKAALEKYTARLRRLKIARRKLNMAARILRKEQARYDKEAEALRAAHKGRPPGAAARVWKREDAAMKRRYRKLS